MSKKQKTLIKSICKSAKLYKDNLVGKTFMYVLEDGRYIEVMFLRRNFKHLTGVESDLSANDFYSKASKNKLAFSQVRFTSDHPYRLAAKKIKHLCDLSEMAVSELFVLEEIKTDSRTYRFGTTDMNLTLCLDDDSKNSYLVPTSLRAEDCFSKSKEIYSVSRIYSKRNDEKLYSSLAFSDDTEQELSDEIKALISIDEE